MIRNLLYHLYPVAAGGIWRRRVGEILRRINLFNGKRVCAIVCDGTTDHPAKAMKALAGHDFRFILLGNNSKRREVQTFEPLFSAVETTSPGEVTFYGHAKGVTYPDPAHVVHRWTDICYETCLDYWPLVAEALASYPLAGPFLRTGSNFDPRATAGRWMYFGSFWWFRNRDVFEQKDWRRIDELWYGIEPYNAIHFPLEQAYCLFHRGNAPPMDPYNPSYMENAILPDLDRFRREHADKRKEW